MSREIIGRRTIVGGDHYGDMVAGRRTVVGQSGNNNLAEQIRARSAVIVEDRDPNTVRRQVCPVPATVVAAGGVATVTVQPQRLFATKRVSLSQNDGAGAAVVGALVTDIRVGQSSQFVAAGNIPVDSFRPDAVNAFVDLDDADIGNLVTIAFSNPTAADITVEGALFGVVVY